MYLSIHVIFVGLLNLEMESKFSRLGELDDGTRVGNLRSAKILV